MKKLKNTAAGIAAKRPIAVVIRASEMPGATTARLAEPMRPMSPNASMMPHTVPKRPMKGVTLAVVARKLSAPLEPRHLDAGRARERARERLEAAHGRPPGARRRRAAAHLLVHLDVAGLEDADERARLELRADGVHLGELGAPAEDVEEGGRLGAGAVERHSLVDDDGPRDQREDEQEQQDRAGDPAGAGDEAGDAARECLRLGLGQEGEKRPIKPL